MKLNPMKEYKINSNKSKLNPMKEYKINTNKIK